MGLSKHRRLHRREEFRRALRDGNRVRDDLLSIIAVESDNSDADPRYGFAIPKRVGGAVARNRIKRRLRAIVAKSDHPKGWDYVIYCFPASAGATYAQLAASVKRLMTRLETGKRVRPKRSRTQANGKVSA